MDVNLVLVARHVLQRHGHDRCQICMPTFGVTVEGDIDRFPCQGERPKRMVTNTNATEVF